MSADRVLRRLRRDLGLAYSGSWRRPVLDDGLVFFNYRDFVLLVRVEPQPEVVTLLTADDMHRFVDEQEPLPALGAWDAAENRYVFALRSRPAIAAIDEAGHFEIVSDWSAVEAAGQQMDVWGVGWGDVDVDVDVVLPNGALVVRAWFLVDPDALNPRSSRPYLLLLDGAPSATVLATPEELAEQVDPECTCRAGRAAVLPDGSLLTTVEQVRDGAVNHYHFRLTPGERPVRWREPEALAHAFGYVPELHPVADGTYRIFTPRRFDLVTREPRLLFGGSIFSYAPPADLRLEVSWVDLLTAAESSNANLGSLAVAEGGTVFFKHFDRHSYNSFSEHWSGVWRTAAGDPPELLASVGGLDDAFNPEEHNSWPGLRYLLARDDDHLLFVGDRVGFSDLPDAVLEVDADGEVRVLLDAFAPGGGRVLPEGVNGVFNDLALDPNGDVLVLTGTGVLQLPADGGEVLVRLHADAVREITGADPYLWTFAVGPDGTIVIFDYWTYSLIRLPPDAAPELVPVVRETLGELFDFRRNGTSTPEDAFLDADGNFVARTFLMQPFNLDDADLIAISPEGEAFFPVPREALLEAAGNPPGVHVEGVERLPSLKVTAVAPTPDGGILLFERNSRRLLLACPARAGEP